MGASLEVGYFAQAHDELTSENTVLDELLATRDMDPGQARSHLAQYLFRGDDVFKPVSALSGGERGRLALAILALRGQISFYWTSRPITWTYQRGRSYSRFCKISAARSCWFHTIDI